MVRATHPRRLHLAALALGLLVAGVTAACGSSEPVATDPPPSSAGQPGTTGTTAPDAATATTTRSPGTTERRSPGTTSRSPGTTSTTSGPASSTTSTSIQVTASPDNEEFCLAFASINAEIDAAFEAAFTRTDDAAAGEELLALFKRTFQRLYDLSPDAIKADWKVLNDKIQSTPSAEALFTSQDDAAAEQAGDTIGEWTKANCGFDPDMSS